MADAFKSPLTNGVVTTGVATTQTQNAKTESAKLAAAENLRGQLLRPPPGGKLYELVGAANTSLQHGTGFINFIGGRYATADADELATLAYFANVRKIIRDITAEVAEQDKLRDSANTTA